MLNDIQITSDYMSRGVALKRRVGPVTSQRVLIWVRTIRSLVQGRIHKLKYCVNSRPKSVFKDKEAVKCLSSLHDSYVIVPEDQASNNIVMYLSLYGVLWRLGIQYK
jgi:hypothetical protein